MSYDLVLVKEKGSEFHYQEFKKDVNNLTPLSDEELMYGDESEDINLLDYNLYAIKHDKNIKKSFLKYLNKRGVKLTFFEKIFNKYDLELAKEYIKDCMDEGVFRVLTVFAHPSHKEEFELIPKQMKFLARKYDLRLYDPQVNDYIDVSEDSSEVKYLKQGK